MPDTIVQFDAPDGLTLTLKLYADGADTIVNGASGDTCTERTNNNGTYTATVTQALTGLHHVRVTDANDNTIAKYVVHLADDTSTYTCHDPIASINGANWQTTLDNYSATRGFSGTALPAAAADAAGGLPISDAGGLDMDDMATATALATAQADLDTITGSDGVTLATAQGNYAPAKVADILTTALTEAYAADGAAPTLTEAVCLIMQHLSESSISGTTKTVKKLDGSTTAATFTLDDATTPTSITRAT